MDIVVQILVKPNNISKRSNLARGVVLEIKQSFTICLLFINLQPVLAQVKLCIICCIQQFINYNKRFCFEYFRSVSDQEEYFH